MIVKLLTEHNLEFLSLKGRCTGLSESIHVKCHIVENQMSWLNYYSEQTNKKVLLKDTTQSHQLVQDS